MYNLNKADELYKKKLDKDPNFDKKLIEKWKEEMPEEYAKFMYRQEYGNHIGDKSMYENAVRNLKWSNGKGNGAKWDADELAQKSGLDFDYEDFTPYDYSYAANMLYSEYNDIYTEPAYYMKMARNYLRNDNYPYKGGERAYHDAQMRSRRYNYGNHYREVYDPYNYNSYSNYNNNSRYNYENRRGGTGRDRDNDGRYNEGR